MQSLGDQIIRMCDVGFGSIESVHRSLGRRKVENISTDELHALMETDPASFVLVDVRSESEQAISKIVGAITQQQYEASPESFADKQAIVYCTVGGRAYLYARKLVARGVNAKNYRDGILGWCRAGLPLQTLDGQPTVNVHTYWRIFHVPDPYQTH